MAETKLSETLFVEQVFSGCRNDLRYLAIC